MFEGFTKSEKMVNGVSICYRIGGKGPGLLLLHGHPQTHVLFRKVAQELAQHFTVVAADLRGYGDSGKPEADPAHNNYSKRVMAQDQVDLMRELGFSRFSLLAHDRGARVGHRMAVDHPDRLDKLVFLDISPTLAMYTQTTEAFARAYWHWFALIQPYPLPEQLIESNPEQYARGVMCRAAGLEPFGEDGLAEYVRCLAIPGTARGICEDYRASATIDLDHDREDIAAGRKVTRPLMVFWGDKGIVGKLFDPIAEWRKVATDFRDGKGLPCGHYIAEEAPDILLQECLPFLVGETA